MSPSHVTNLFIYKKEVQWPSWSLNLNAQKFILSFLRSFPATFFSQLWLFCSSWQFVIGDVLQSCRLFCFDIFLAAEILRIVVSAFFVRSFSICDDVFFAQYWLIGRFRTKGVRSLHHGEIQMRKITSPHLPWAKKI